MLFRSRHAVAQAAEEFAVRDTLAQPRALGDEALVASIDVGQQFIEHVFRDRGVATVTAELLFVAFEFFENVRFQIGAPTHIDDFEQRGQRKMVIHVSGSQQQLFKSPKQVFQTQIGANSFVEWVFVKNHKSAL